MSDHDAPARPGQQHAHGHAHGGGGVGVAAEPADRPPLRDSAFRVLWLAGLGANMAGAAREMASGWEMAGLTSSELLVASVQTAVALPSFALAVPAGALADVVDRRRLLVAVQVISAVSAAALAVTAAAGVLVPGLLLLLTAVLGVASAAGNPAWQTYMSSLVSPARIAESSALNSLSMNLARAVGPALGGFVVARTGGPWVVFALHGLCLAAMAVVLRGSPSPQRGRVGGAPAERLVGAVRAGWRYVRYSAPLRAVLVRTTSFVLPSSALWALLPLVARDSLGLGAGGYGVLMGCMGAGAVTGAVAFPWARRWLTYNTLALGSSVAMALCLTALAIAAPPWAAAAYPAMFVGGGGWVTVVMCSNSSAQAGAPSWVRARALSWYFTMHFGCMAGGSALWGALAQVLPEPVVAGGPAGGLSAVDATLLAAAALLLAGTLTLPRWPFAPVPAAALQRGAWPDPVVNRPIDPDDGPVVVTILYTIDPRERAGFTRAMADLSVTRFRDGAINWLLCQDTDDPARWTELFIVESWAEHLRQHDRVTAADIALLRVAHGYHTGPLPPVVRHAIAAPVRTDADRRAGGAPVPTAPHATAPHTTTPHTTTPPAGPAR